MNRQGTKFLSQINTAKIGCFVLKRNRVFRIKTDEIKNKSNSKKKKNIKKDNKMKRWIGTFHLAFVPPIFKCWSNRIGIENDKTINRLLQQNLDEVHLVCIGYGN